MAEQDKLAAAAEAAAQAATIAAAASVAAPVAEAFSAVLDGYIGCKKPYCLIRRPDKEMEAPRSFNMEFNRVVNPLLFGELERYMDNAAAFAISCPKLKVVRTVCYRPDGKEIVDGMYNMWKDPHIEPLEGAPQIFLDHLKYLITAREERIQLANWLAWIVQHPNEKVMWGIMIVGKGGTGKSWLGKLMERLFGEDNVVLVSEENTVTSTFNGFSENRRFVFLHETPPENVKKLMNNLRGVITESHTRINRKGIEEYKAENHANVIGIVNEDIQVALDNRRWAVFHAADDPYGDNAEQHAAYYKRLWDVVPPDGSVTDEARRILWWLQKCDLKDFNRLTAPLTGTKEEAAQMGDSGQVKGNILQAYRDKEGPFRFSVLTMEEVKRHCGHEEDKAVSVMMDQVGCRKLRRDDGREVQIRLEQARPRLWAISRKVAEELKGKTIPELTAIYLKERTGAGKVQPMPLDEREANF